jgi:hypothetical protein
MSLSPSDAVDEEQLGAEAAEAASEEAADAAADAAAGESSGISLRDLLLATEPDMDRSQIQREVEVGPAGAHAYIGVRKMLSEAVPSLGERRGTTALEHFGIAGYHVLDERRDDQDDEDDDRERSDELDDLDLDEPPGANRPVGGGSGA